MILLGIAFVINVLLTRMQQGRAGPRALPAL
jgi:hypothetical protein